MSLRPLIAASVAAALLSVLFYKVFFLFSIVAIPIAGLVGGLVFGILRRPVGWSEVAIPAGVVAAVATVSYMLAAASVGGRPLEGRYLVSWLVCVLLGTLSCSLVARAVGALAPRAVR